MFLLRKWCSAIIVLAATQVASADEASAPPRGLSSSDWSGIRAAYEAGRHAIYPLDGGYQARNPGQQWRTNFDGRGFVVTPDAGARLASASSGERFGSSSWCR